MCLCLSSKKRAICLLSDSTLKIRTCGCAPALYGTEGHWGVGSKSDLVLTAYLHPKGLPKSVATGVSTWQRATDLTLPYRIKTSANYQVARLAKIEGRKPGYPEMVLLNQFGRVAESIGSAILMVRDGQVVTPPTWEGAIESITIDIVECLCRSLSVSFVRRPIDRTELLVADEMAFVGTLNDITIISQLDGSPFPESVVLKRIADRYLAAVTGVNPHSSIDLSCRPRRETGT